MKIMKDKKYFENEIRKLTKEILNKEELIKIKNLENGLEKTAKNPEIIELVEFNFSKDFLMEIPQNANNVLAMGINPSGGKEIICKKEIVKDSILFLENLVKEEEKELKIFNETYIFTHEYHKSNYKLFSKIYAKAHWAMKGYLNDDEIEKMIKNVTNKTDDIQNIKNIIRKMQKKEREKTRGKYKKDVYVLFGDLLWYNDGSQKNIEKAINVNNLNHNIRKIIELNIEYYNPKLIVITNAMASHLVENALTNEKENIDRIHKDVLICKNTPIILGSMVSGRGTMDIFSQERLKDRIEEIYKE